MSAVLASRVMPTPNEEERTEELLYFSLSNARDARVKMGELERREEEDTPEWWYQADARRNWRHDAQRYYALMVTRGWTVSATCIAMMQWEGLLP